jgi:flagellar hook-associated protein 1 FlgK
VNLDNALVVASGGLANINRQMSLISQNVANAGTPNYAVETSTQQSLTADGQGLGVHSGPAVRDVDLALQGQVLSENATVAGLQTRQSSLQALDATQGTPGQGGDLASLIGDLQNQFSTLLNSPDSQAQQAQVVSSATALAQGINRLSAAYTTQRQTAQDSIVGGLDTLNASLATIGSLSNKIVALHTSGQSTADLENQRDAAISGLSQLVDVKVLQQPNGAVLITTDTGFTLPLQGGTPFSTNGAAMQPNSYYPGGGVPPIMLGGVDVTKQLQGGQIGANITLRDTTLPTDQAELDEFAQNLASRFAGQGLTLFSDPTGVVPAGGGVPAQNGYVGFAGIIQVNPAVQADPAAVRDGTPSINASGLAGFTGIINQVLNATLGATPALASNVSGLGPAGNLNAPYAAPATLRALASTVLAAQAQESASTTNQLTTEQAVQSTLTGKLSAQSGVNMDTEMSLMIQLQNAYGANAKVIAAVQSMWTQLLSTVQ